MIYTLAHCYETGGMRRCTLRGHENILKRLPIYIGAFNISLALRKMLGAGKPRELKNRAAMLILGNYILYSLLELANCLYVIRVPIDFPSRESIRSSV